MSGFITERNLDEAEAAFPGIGALYRTLRTKPPTFLDLLGLYWHERDASGARHLDRPPTQP